VEPNAACDVVVIGGINSDYLVRGRDLPSPGSSLDGETFFAASGGKGANAAVAATRLGAACVLLARGVEAVIVGAEGGNLLAWRGGDEWLPDNQVDSTGAGDAFSATFAVALAEGQSLVAAGRLASGASALATTALGAQAGLPRRAQLEAYVGEISGARSRGDRQTTA